jgi:hypothetical protein
MQQRSDCGAPLCSATPSLQSELLEHEPANFHSPNPVYTRLALKLSPTGIWAPSIMESMGGNRNRTRHCSAALRCRIAIHFGLSLIHLRQRGVNHLVRSPRIRFESDQPEPRSTSVGELVQVYTIGNDICAISEISVGTHKATK